eukprot:PhM_4_TR15697/c0_g1_i2/m.11385/K11838/USP7, UBP15; ubiquitin carboxyl-terminal hydrolase 7
MSRLQDCKNSEQLLEYLFTQYPDARKYVTKDTIDSMGIPVDTLVTMPEADRRRVFRDTVTNMSARTYLMRLFMEVASKVYTSHGAGSTLTSGGGTAPSSLIPSARIAKLSGIKNHGSACYLNSLIQSLFHLSYFRAAIYQMPTEDNVDPKTNIPLALQRLFYAMEMRTERGTASALPTPVELMQSFGWDIDERQMQHDIHELMRVLLDNLMTKMVDGNQPNVIRQLFAGVMMNYIETTDESAYKSQRKESFMDLQLVIRDMKDIYDSLHNLFAEETLDGSNKYLVEGPDGTKSYHPARKGCKLHVAPPVLVFHCNRYDFSLVTLRNEKVTNKWQYYDTIDMSEFVKDGLAARQHSGHVTPEGLGQREDSDAFYRESSLHCIPEDTVGYVYRLYSVVTYTSHYGGRGHYYSYVRTNNREWIKFNDENVTHASTDEVFDGNFGGKVRSQYSNYEVDSPSVAYMLVYVREDVSDRLVFPSEDIVKPPHLKQRFEEEQAMLERRRKAKAEDTKCINLHVCTLDDIDKHCNVNMRGVCLRANIPDEQCFKMQKLGTVQELKPLIAERLGIPVECQALWRCEARMRSTPFLPEAFMNDEERFRDLFRGCIGNFYESEMWDGDVIVIDTRKTKTASAGAPSTNESEVFLKVYDPSLVGTPEFPVKYLGSIRLKNREPISAAVATVRELANLAPTDDITFEKESAYSFGFTDVNLTRTPDSLDVSDGDVLIAVKKTPGARFATASAYLHYVEHKVVVKLANVMTPNETEEITLLDDQTYKDVQKEIAARVGADPEFVRLVVHDIKKGVPDFTSYRNRSNCNYTLRSLLASYDGETDRLYFEVCSIKVIIIDTSEVVRFDAVNSAGQSILTSPACFVLPKYAKTRDVFKLIRENIPEEHRNTLGPLRLISSYFHTIWSVYAEETDDPNTDVRSLYSATTYRVEEIPRRVDTSEPQELCDVCHFSYSTGRVQRHGSPFSMYVTKTDTPETLLLRVQALLGLPTDGAPLSWRVFIVPYDDYWHHPRVVPKGESVLSALSAAPGRDLHIGLEHPDTTSASGPKESALTIRN